MVTAFRIVWTVRRIIRIGTDTPKQSTRLEPVCLQAAEAGFLIFCREPGNAGCAWLVADSIPALCFSHRVILSRR